MTFPDTFSVDYEYDFLGRPTAVKDGATSLATITYSDYGEPAEAGGFPFRFTGQKYDEATGLYYYKARWYDPETGRFMQTDPIGYGDGMNMYAYVGNDPVNSRDPSGMAGEVFEFPSPRLQNGGTTTTGPNGGTCSTNNGICFLGPGDPGSPNVYYGLWFNLGSAPGEGPSAFGGGRGGSTGGSSGEA